MAEDITSEDNLERFVMYRPNEVRLVNSNAAESEILYIIPQNSCWTVCSLSLRGGFQTKLWIK